MSLDLTAEAAGAEDVAVIGVAGDAKGARSKRVVAGAGNCGTRVKSPAGYSTSDAPPPGGALAKIRGAAQFKIDTARLKSAWRANSIGRVALLAVCSYVLCTGAAYFFLMQPLSTKLHEVKEQKSILHDYVVIQQAGAAIGAFKDGLMTGDQRLTVMSEVNQMAESSGVKIVGDPDLLLRRAVSPELRGVPGQASRQGHVPRDGPLPVTSRELFEVRSRGGGRDQIRD